MAQGQLDRDALWDKLRNHSLNEDEIQQAITLLHEQPTQDHDLINVLLWHQGRMRAGRANALRQDQKAKKETEKQARRAQRLTDVYKQALSERQNYFAALKLEARRRNRLTGDG